MPSRDFSPRSKAAQSAHEKSRRGWARAYAGHNRRLAQAQARQWGGERESASRSRATSPTLPDACSAGRRPSALLADRGYLVCLTHGLGGPCTDSAAVGASCAPRAAAEPRPRCLQGDASSESECAISASAASTMARVFAAGYLCTATCRVIATRAARPRPLPNGAPERGHRFPSPLEEQRCRPPGAECLCARGPDRAWAPDKQEGALPGRPGRA